MAAGRLFLPGWMPALDNNGAPIPAASVFFYLNETDTLAAVYSDEGLSVPLSNPVSANSSGRFPAIWADDAVTYSYSISAPYGPAGIPFTGDGLSVSHGVAIMVADAAEAAAAEAAESAVASAASADESEAALAEIIDIASGAPEAPSIINKLNRDGSNPATGLLANIGAVPSADLAASTGAGLVGFIASGTGAVARTAQAKLRDGPISTADWGITADSNGTTGNGTDWTTKLQQLVTYARANGRNIWIPARPGFYIRFTAPIDFTGAQTKMEVIGESNFDSAFFADFTSASNVAAFSNNGTSGARSYVAWRNFRLQGRIGAPNTNKVRGIYSNWGGEFTEFESVFLFHFWDNIVVANDYTVRFTNCLSWYARNDCIQTGYDITGAIGACNTVSYIGTVTTHAGRYGKYTSYCRAAVIDGGSDEACAGGNTFFDSVSGFDISGHYVEYAPSEPGNPPVQVWLRNCNGGTVNGLSASAFDNAGNPVILVQDSASISLKGLAIEQVGAALDAVGVLIDNSTVEVSGFFQGMSKGVVASNGGRVTITNSNILATIPVSTGAGAGCVITWKEAVDAQVAASVASINAISAVDIYRTTLNKNIIDNTKNFQGVGTQGNLAAAAQVTVINAELASESYRIDNIRLEVVDAFAGGGGDRNLVIRDSTTIYSTIPAASLQLLGARGLWDSAVVPLPAGGALTPTVAGGDLYIQYAGGTTDYTTGGVVVMYIEATRIT